MPLNVGVKQAAINLKPLALLSINAYMAGAETRCLTPFMPRPVVLRPGLVETMLGRKPEGTAHDEL